MAETIEGLVLCQAGGHRLAFAAAEITGIDLWNRTAAGIPYARAAFGLPAAAGRLVLNASAAVVVDALEISSESAQALPVPPALRSAAGGAIVAFVMMQGLLWPLLALVPFARYVEAQPVVAA